MNTFTALKRGLVLSVGLSAGLALATPGVAQDRLAVGTTSSSSSQYGYYVSVAQVLKTAGIDLQVVETGASLDNLRRLDRGQVDMGLVTTNIAKLAAEGHESIPQQSDTQTLWIYAQLPQNVIVRADAGIDSIAALDGAKYNPGIRGSATESTAERVFAAMGIAPDFVRGSTGDTVDAIKDNRVTGYVKSGVGHKVDGSTLDLASFTQVKILGLTDAQKQAIAKDVSDVTLMDVPAGAIDGAEAYTTWSMGFATVVKPDFDAETAYRVAKAIFEDEEIQRGAFAVTGEFDLAQLTIDVATTPLHPGTIRYLEEQGYDVPDTLRP